LGAEFEPTLGQNSDSREHHDRTTSSVEVATETLVPQRRIAWAELLQRVFEVDALGCPSCGGRMRVLSAITDPTVAARILRCLALPSRAPPLATSGDGAGHTDSAADESFGGIPEFDFDQSQPSGDCESSA